MSVHNDIKKLHAVFTQITPFCRAGSNPQVAQKIQEAEVLFIKIEGLAKNQEAELKALMETQE